MDLVRSSWTFGLVMGNPQLKSVFGITNTYSMIGIVVEIWWKIGIIEKIPRN